MKIVIQRVLHSSVDVEGRVVGQTGQGLCCLVGVGHDDSIMDAEWICRKLLNLKLWPDETGKPWQRSVMDLDGGVLLISQFTLFATLKGNKPDYHLAMGTGAREFFERFVAMVRQAYKAERVSSLLTPSSHFIKIPMPVFKMESSRRVWGDDEGSLTAR